MIYEIYSFIIAVLKDLTVEILSRMIENFIDKMK